MGKKILLKNILKIETQKINEQNKFLRRQEQEAEIELKKFLIDQDKTEFASENVEYVYL